jgi:hypothetical protein
VGYLERSVVSSSVVVYAGYALLKCDFMILPLCFRNVPYKVAGSSKYKGDLILTHEIIYYFPHTDIATKWFSIIGTICFVVFGILAIPVLFVLGIIFPAAAQEAIKSLLESGFKGAWKVMKNGRHSIPEQNNELLHPENVDASLVNLFPLILHPVLWYRLILDCAVLTLKENQSVLSSSLPAPMRFSKNGIHCLSLSFIGTLTIETEFDMKNRFSLGVFKKDLLRRGLKAARFSP